MQRDAYHVGSSKEGVIWKLALSHRGISDRQDGEVAQDAYGIPTYVYVDHVCVCAAPVAEPIKT